MVRIGIAIVQRQEAVLVGVRGPDGPLPGKAEFPGGKCHPDESAADCAVRECLEETGLAVTPVGLLHETEFQYPHGAMHLSFFDCRPTDDPPPSPLGNFRWHPRADLTSLPFPDGNREVVRQLTSSPSPSV